MGEPLKYGFNPKEISDKEKVYMKGQVKSAIEWLKKELKTKKYKGYEQACFELIDRAFEDVIK